jgi:DNA polymerase V
MPVPLLSTETLKQTPIAIADKAAPVPIPLFVQKIQAGFPSPACDYIEEGLDLTDYLVKNKSSSFLFKVASDSMKDAGIFPGDIVSVDRSIEPKHGHIVVAVIHNEFTLKRLYRKRGVVELHPDNPAYEPIRLKECEELQVWAVATGVVRKFKV